MFEKKLEIYIKAEKSFGKMDNLLILESNMDVLNED